MLNEEVAKYRELSGDTNPNTPISRIGGYLDGYEKALEQEPCEDAISRQAVLDITWEEPSYADPLNVLTEVRDKVNDLPPVNPQPKTGHWIRVTDKSGHLVWECGKCSWQQRYNTNFCPDCGVKMVEPQERSEV